MNFPVLENYLARLPQGGAADARVWLDGSGRAQGRYFNCTLTSAFQPVRELASGRITGFEAFLRSHSGQDEGLSLWKLLDQAADDDESVELDRLCRMLHAINFFRQPQAGEGNLYLSVHDRLLAAVSGNHGMAFRRILDGLGLPHSRIVLQLPVISESQGWLLNQVADNYRLNGFRVALNARDAGEALRSLQRVRPDVLKVDAREIADENAVRALLLQAGRKGIRLIFKRLENQRVRQTLARLDDASAQEALHVQGRLWEAPASTLSLFATAFAPTAAAQPTGTDLGAG